MSARESGARSRRARAGGFTVVELVITITVILILTLLAVPRWDAAHEITLRAAARRVASDLRYAQSQAALRRVPHGVLFDPDRARYSVFAPTPQAPVPDPVDRGRPLGIAFRSSAEYRGVGLESAAFGATRAVTFDPLGVPRDAAGHELERPGRVVLSYEGARAVVEVSPETGKVTVR